MAPRSLYGECGRTGCSCYAKSTEDFRRKFTAIPVVPTRDGKPWCPEGWDFVKGRSKICRQHFEEFNRRWSEDSTAKDLRSQGSAPIARTSKPPVSSPGSKVGSGGSKKSSRNGNVDASTGPALRTIFDPILGLVGTVAPNKGAGDCLFRAISCIVYGTEDLHWLVRDMICNWMVLNWHYYEDLFSDKAAFDRHVRGMRSHGTWGDGYEIFAAMHLYRRCAMIYGTDGTALSVPMRSLFESYEPFAGATPINLAYTHNNFEHGHYEGVVSDADKVAMLAQLSAGTFESESIANSMTDEVIEEQERAATARLLHDITDAGEQQAIINGITREKYASIVTPEDGNDGAMFESGAKRSLLGSLTMEIDGDGWVETHPWVGQRVLLPLVTHYGESYEPMGEITSVLVERGRAIQIEYLDDAIGEQIAGTTAEEAQKGMCAWDNSDYKDANDSINQNVSAVEDGLGNSDSEKEDEGMEEAELAAEDFEAEESDIEFKKCEGSDKSPATPQHLRKSYRKRNHQRKSHRKKNHQKKTHHHQGKM